MELEQQKVGRFARCRQKIKKLPRWLKWTVAILVLFLIIGTAVFSNKGSDGMMVKTEQVKMRPIEQSVFTNGRLESADKQEFFTPVDSTLMELEVEVGDKVKKGEVLGRLDTMELGRLYEEAKAKLAERESELASALASDDQLAFNSAKAQYEKEKNNYDRINRLYQQGAATKKELETANMSFGQAKVSYHEAKTKLELNANEKKVASAQAQVDLAKQEVAQAKERLDLATFVAENDGVVLSVEAEKGNRVLEGNRILEVGSGSELEVTAQVNEIDAGSLQVGQSVTITCTTLPGKKFEGKVTRVAAVAVTGSDSSISVPVTVKLDKNIEGLKPGYTVDMNIITMEEQKLLTVPFEALITKNGGKVAYVVEDGVAKERQVETKKGNELYDVVESGLKKGEVVILNPPRMLKDGQQVITGDKNDSNK